MKEVFRRSIFRIVRLVVAVTGNRGAKIIREACSTPAELIDCQDTRWGKIKFYSINDLSRERAATLLEKEPETIDWIDQFEEGDVFWDIGANIGVYSLYAAAANRGPIFAFEPSAFNYALLNRNIKLNEFDDRIRAYCVALSDDRKASVLYMSNTDFGGALSSFGEAVDHCGSEFTPSFCQGMIGFSIDEFIELFDFAFPNRIKIDVDGIEDRIIAGAKKTLADPRLKSLSVELDEARTDYTGALVDAIEAAGLRLSAKRHGSSYDTGAFSTVYNYQFTRGR